MTKDLLKSSVVYTFLGFLPLSFSLVFTPIYLNYMSESEYGLLNLFMVYSGILSQIYSLGISSIFTYQFWDVYQDKQKLKELISSTLGGILLIQVIMISILSIIGKPLLKYLVANDEFTFTPFFICTLLFAAFMVHYELFLALFRNQSNLKAFSWLAVGSLALMTIGSLIGVVWLEMQAEGAVYGRLFGYGILVVFFAASLIKKFGLSLNFNKLKGMLILGVPVFINGLIGSFGYGIDKIMVERILSLEALGIYAFAVVIASTLETLFNALNNALSPTIYKMMKETKKVKDAEINRLVHAIILVLIIAISILLIVLQPVLNVLIPQNFHEAAQYVPILVVAILWRAFTTIEVMALYKKKKTNYFVYNQITFLTAAVVFGYFLLNQFGLLGIAMAIYIARVIEFIVMKLLVNSVDNLDLDLKRLQLATIIFSIVSFTAAFLYFETNSQIFYTIPFFCAVILCVSLLQKESKEFIKILKYRNQSL